MPALLSIIIYIQLVCAIYIGHTIYEDVTNCYLYITSSYQSL